MRPSPVKLFDGVEQTLGQLLARNALIGTGKRAKICPRTAAFVGVSYHQVGVRLYARAFADFEQRLIVDADFELEFDENAAESPVRSDLIHKLRSFDEAQPKLFVLAAQLAAGARGERGSALPLVA